MFHSRKGNCELLPKFDNNFKNLRPEEAVLAAIKGNTEDDNSVLPE